MPATTTTTSPSCRGCGDCSAPIPAPRGASNDHIDWLIQGSRDTFGIEDALIATIMAKRSADGRDPIRRDLDRAAYIDTMLVVRDRIERLLLCKPPQCRKCSTSHLLGRLIDTAVAACEDERKGTSASWEANLHNRCMLLASYAGDDFPDADATRAVLERARDVFLAALDAMTPEQLPQ